MQLAYPWVEHVEMLGDFGMGSVGAWRKNPLFPYKVGPYDRYKWGYGAPINGPING